MDANAFKVGMRAPDDVSAAAELLDRRAFSAEHVVAILGKTEGNGAVNDYARARDAVVPDAARRADGKEDPGHREARAHHLVRRDRGIDGPARDDHHAAPRSAPARGGTEALRRRHR